MLDVWLKNNWIRLTGEASLSDLHLSLISSCSHAFGNILGLVFIDGQIEPDYLIKFCRDERFSMKLKREYASLIACHEHSALSNIAPRPVFSEEIQGRTLFMQSAKKGDLFGKKFLALKSYGDRKTLLLGVLNALVEINTLNLGSESLDENQSIENRYGFGLCPDELKKCGINTHDISRLLGRYSVLTARRERYFIHGDFWQNNILIGTHGLNVSGVFDWEFSGMKSPVPLDIIWLMISLSRLLIFMENSHSLSLGESFRAVFYRKSRSSELLQWVYDQYREMMPLDIALDFSDLLELSLAHLAMREFYHYGAHYDMDVFCLDLLNYAISHRDSLAIQT